jgi:hypothetical protein
MAFYKCGLHASKEEIHTFILKIQWMKHNATF